MRAGGAGYGFTKFAIDLLAEQRSCVIGTETKVLGGPLQLQSVQRKCMARMGNWVMLVMASIRAEFPAFELLQSFRVFNLNVSGGGGDRRHGVEAVHRMASVFKVDPTKLRLQLFTLRESPPAHPKTATLAKCSKYGVLGASCRPLGAIIGPS